MCANEERLKERKVSFNGERLVKKKRDCHGVKVGGGEMGGSSKSRRRGK